MRIKGNNPNCNLFFAYRDIKNIVIIFVILNQSNVLMVMLFFVAFFHCAKETQILSDKSPEIKYYFHCFL